MAAVSLMRAVGVAACLLTVSAIPAAAPSTCSADGTCGSGELEDMSQLQHASPKRATPVADDTGIAHETEGGQDEERAECHEELQIFPYVQAHLWGIAYKGWEQCAGRSQSPINFPWWPRPQRVTGPKLNITYRMNLDGKWLNNGHALKVKGNYLQLSLDGAVYESPQFHFHHPSEHRVHGQQTPLEMHIVTVGERGLAVIGILFYIGRHNDCLAKMLETPPTAGCSKHVAPADLYCFQWQLEGPWWSYSGSLTTPPCTEGVAWNVMQRPATVSEEQLEAFQSRFEGNARPAQPLNGRLITAHGVAGR